MLKILTLDNSQVLALANYCQRMRRHHPDPLGPALAGAMVELDRAAVEIIQAGDLKPVDLPPALFEAVQETP